MTPEEEEEEEEEGRRCAADRWIRWTVRTTLAAAMLHCDAASVAMMCQRHGLTLRDTRDLARGARRQREGTMSM